MLDELSMHLRASAGPELQGAIEEACDFFETFELPEWQDRYVDLLMTLDNGEMGDNVQAIAQLTSNLQRVLLVNFQITIHDEVTVSEGNLILRTLRDLEHTEHIEEIKTICGEENDPVEAFAALMVLIVHDRYHTVETYHAYLVDVPQSLIDRTLEITLQRTPDTVEGDIIDVDLDKELIASLKTYMMNLQLEDVMIRGLISEGLRLDLPFQTYYDHIINFVAPIEPRKMAIELYGAFIVSRERKLEPRNLIGEALQLTYSSIDAVTPVMGALDQVVLAAHITQTSGVRKV